MSSIDDEIYLFIGIDPEKVEYDVFAPFTANKFIPIGWYCFFKPEDFLTQKDLNVDSDDGENGHDTDNNEPVMIRTSLPTAQRTINEYIQAFKNIPYLWSYFRVLSVLDEQLEKFIRDLEDGNIENTAQRFAPHPDVRHSQVEVIEDTEQFVEDMSVSMEQLLSGFPAFDESTSDAPAVASPAVNDESFTIDESNENGFADDLLGALAELEDFGSAPTSSSAPSSSSTADELSNLSTEALLTEFELADEKDQELVKVAQEEEQRLKTEMEKDVILPIIVQFENITGDGRGARLKQVPLLLERLRHHANREGKMTRVMQDILQEIFRESLTGWRITGNLSEDFTHGKPSDLSSIMLGVYSPILIINENFDLNYWTKGTLQQGDERLMYTLSQLPTEEIHRAIKSGRLQDISNEIGDDLVITKSIPPPDLQSDQFFKKPIVSNLWGFRVLIQEGNDQRIATLLCSDVNKSWREDFEAKLRLPGVLEDWNIKYTIRFDDFTDTDEYQLVFTKAKNVDQAFQGFIRWVRRQNLMYRVKYGTKGTISLLKQLLLETVDKKYSQFLFNTLVSLTALGFDDAIEALSDEAVLAKLA